MLRVLPLDQPIRKIYIKLATCAIEILAIYNTIIFDFYLKSYLHCYYLYSIIYARLSMQDSYRKKCTKTFIALYNIIAS